MSAVAIQEVPQALKRLHTDLNVERSRVLSGARDKRILQSPSLEVDVSGGLGLPRLTVCRSPRMEWRPIETTDNSSSSSCSPLEPPEDYSILDSTQSDPIDQLSQSHPAPLCSSTPDIQQTSECIDEQLSNQTTTAHIQSCTRSRTKHRRHSNNCRLLSRSQVVLNRNRSKSLNTEQTGSPTHKRTICDFEQDLTFRPRLNDYSLKLVSQSTRSSVPLMNRLLVTKKSVVDPYHEKMTFVPKLNPASVKMAQERAARIQEIQAKMAEQATARKAEALSEYTFKPRVSLKSLKLAQSLGTSFQARQQRHLERRQRALDEAYKATTITKRLVRPNHRVPPLPHNSKENSPVKQELVQKTTTPSRATKPLPDHTTAVLDSDSCDNSSPSTPNKPKGAGARRRKNEDGRFKMAASPQAGGEGAGRLTICGPKFSSMSDGDRVKRIKVKSEGIIKARKVFRIMDGYRLIRQGLRRRGWVEQDYHKTTPTSTPKKTPVKQEGGGASDDSDCEDDIMCEDEEVYSDEEEYCMMSRAVRNAVPNFVWSLKRYEHIYRNLNRDSLVNHFAKASSFTTKVGLCSNLRNLVWYGDTDPHTFFPRCYKLSCDEEKDMFIDDYRLTSALCILKMISTQFTTVGEGETLSLGTEELVVPSSPRQSSTPTNCSPMMSSPGTTRPILCEEGLALAIRAINFFVSSKQHDDIEGSETHLYRRLSEVEWNLVIKYFYKMVFERAVIKISDCFAISEANSLLDQVEELCPQLYMDGSRNVWIVKPGAMSRGRGIMCMNNLEDILNLVSSTVKKEGRWVVQKYIERPLLVYETKFDVRQWFLVTDWNPLTMWIYKDCYLRFCTQTYTLDDLDESVHLCNNSIQRNYANSTSRAQALPSDNMWDSATFRDYLESIGEGDKWDSVIYPGMKQALVHVLQVTQDEIEHRKCSFELYGADFMISSDYRPWLIEVNSSPSMSLSTSVTARLCRAVLEDTLKVVVDRRDNRNCETGGFELAYKQVKLDQPSYVGMQLCIQGSSIIKPREPTFIRKTTSSLTLHKPQLFRHLLQKSDNDHTPDHPPHEPHDSHEPHNITTPSVATTIEGVFDKEQVATSPRIPRSRRAIEPLSLQPLLSPVKSARRRIIPHTKPRLDAKPRTHGSLNLDAKPRVHGSPNLDAKLRLHGSPNLDAKLRLHGSPNLDAKPRVHGSPNLERKARPHGSPRQDSGLMVAVPRLGESIPHKLTTAGEGIALSISKGNVNPVTRKLSPEK